ncbi:uncharacterized protein LOC106172733 isoform X1 [Lingula anatina]|uniref:Uncharacterized protein LOC106172733 isoform X1 n=1 Tax=Lingula anatina TaxID=7574 RepID=A0A1S3JF32_LINAN|nr:uncharacterized protein LOC106172733 isoform X1 [Lingula anatina]|eukprot:XP_013409022.1 uncharacterized protein LOC106172733 isoform X1 [Lingula anatina]
MARFAARNDGPAPVSKPKQSPRKTQRYEVLLGWNAQEAGDDTGIEAWMRRKNKYKDEDGHESPTRKAPPVKLAWEKYTCVPVNKCQAIDNHEKFKENSLFEQTSEVNFSVKSMDDIDKTIIQYLRQKDAKLKEMQNPDPPAENMVQYSISSDEQGNVKDGVFLPGEMDKKEHSTEDGVNRAKRLIQFVQSRGKSFGDQSRDDSLIPQLILNGDVPEKHVFRNASLSAKSSSTTTTTSSDQSVSISDSLSPPRYPNGRTKHLNIKSAREIGTGRIHQIPKRTAKSAKSFEGYSYSRMLATLANKPAKLSYTHGQLKSPRELSPSMTSGDDDSGQQTPDTLDSNRAAPPSISAESSSEAFMTALNEMKNESPSHTTNTMTTTEKLKQWHETFDKPDSLKVRLPVPTKSREEMVLLKVSLKEYQGSLKRNRQSVENGKGTLSSEKKSTSEPLSHKKNGKTTIAQQKVKVTQGPTKSTSPIPIPQASSGSPSSSANSPVAGVREKSFFPIGELLPAVDSSYQNSMPVRGSKLASHLYRDGLGGGPRQDSVMIGEESTVIVREGIDMIRIRDSDKRHGPPAFRPQFQKTPLQRARDITQKRIYTQLGKLYGQETDDTSLKKKPAGGNEVPKTAPPHTSRPWRAPEAPTSPNSKTGRSSAGASRLHESNQDDVTQFAKSQYSLGVRSGTAAPDMREKGNSIVVER